MITEAADNDVRVITPEGEAAVSVGAENFLGAALVAIDTEERGEPTPVVAGRSSESTEESGALGRTVQASLDRTVRFSNSVDAWIDAGVSLLATHDLVGARRAFDRALELRATSRRAKLGLARVAKQEGHSEEALEHLRAMHFEDPSDLEVRVGLAVTLIEAGDTREATRLLDIDVPVSAPFAMLFAVRGAFYVSTQRYDRAVRDLRRAVKLRPDWAHARNALGIAEVRLGHHPGGERRFREAIRINPLYAEAMMNLLRVLQAEQRWHEMLDAVERYWTPANAPFALSMLVGNAALEAEVPRIARDWFEKATEKASGARDKAIAENNLGVAFDQLDKDSDALKCFLRSTDHWPDDVALANVARVLLDRGETEEAVNWLQVAREQGLGGVQVLQTLASGLSQIDRIDEAVKIAQEAVAEPSADKWAFATLGILFAEHVGDAEQGIDVLRRGLKRWHNDPALWNNLCYSLVLAGRFEEAEEKLQAALVWDLSSRERTHLVATRGLLALRRGMLTDGWRLYEEAAAIAGVKALRERVKVKRDLEYGRALVNRGEHHQARVFLERAASGPSSGRPYTLQAQRELRRLASG